MAAPAHLTMMAHPQSEADLSREFDLLFVCCRPTLETQKISEALAASFSWEAVLRLADHHRVMPALYQALHGREDVPASIHSALQARFQSNSIRALRFSAELVRLVVALRECGIEALAHKGPALAQLLYGDPALRQYGDLDLLVRPGDVTRAIAALQQLGYEPQLQLSVRQAKAYLNTGYEYVFTLGRQKNLLELQWQIVPRFYAVDFNLDAMFQRSAEVVLEGASLESLWREDLMLALCVHAAKHGWAQLGMLRDIAALASSGMYWHQVLAAAREVGVHRIVCISLLLAERLGCTLPPDMGSEKEIRAAKSIADRLMLELLAGKEVNPESLRYFYDWWRYRERWRDRARFVYRLALTPSIGEWQSLRLPDALFPLYHAVRIGRLSWRGLSTIRTALLQASES
jgi:Uncharacterised nucleotidyltransferase